MISKIELWQFRGLEHVQFKTLGRANLIIGGNNTGKTSVLEALVLLFGNQVQLQTLPTTFRELPGKNQDQGLGFWKLLQGAGAKKRLSLERAIQHVPLDWDAEAFAPLRSILVETGS